MCGFGQLKTTNKTKKTYTPGSIPDIVQKYTGGCPECGSVGIQKYNHRKSLAKCSCGKEYILPNARVQSKPGGGSVNAK